VLEFEQRHCGVETGDAHESAPANHRDRAPGPETATRRHADMRAASCTMTSPPVLDNRGENRLVSIETQCGKIDDLGPIRACRVGDGAQGVSWSLTPSDDGHIAAFTTE